MKSIVSIHPPSDLYKKSTLRKSKRIDRLKSFNAITLLYWSIFSFLRHQSLKSWRDFTKYYQNNNNNNVKENNYIRESNCLEKERLHYTYRTSLIYYSEEPSTHLFIQLQQ